MLATKRRTKLSNEGLRQLNMVVRTNENKPFFSSTTIQRAEDKLKNLILFEEGAGKDLKLCSLTEIMNERLNRLESEEKTVVWSLDKGRRRVISTISIVNHPNPQSTFNNLIVQSWIGGDHYESLKSMKINFAYQQLKDLDYTVFVGGDYSFLAALQGMSPAMAYRCIFCSKKFETRKNNEDLDLNSYQLRDNPEVEDMIQSQRYKKRSIPLIDVPLNFIVPPILHFKIKVGNTIFAQLMEVANESPEFEAAVKLTQLNVDRNEEKIIYAKFHGNDIKRLCRSIDILAGKSNIKF